MTWFFNARQVGPDRWLGWCAKTSSLGNGPLEIATNEEVHFEYGPREEDVLSRLLIEVLN